MTTVMVDLEGTLSNHTKRLRVLQRTTTDDPRDRNAWRTYYKGLPDDPPRPAVLAVVKDLIQAGIRPVVYSTRFINKYAHEEEWLRGHELWDHVDLLQRDPSQTKIAGPDLVMQWVEELRPEVIIDDRDEVRTKVRGLVPGIVVYSPHDFKESE